MSDTESHTVSHTDTESHRSSQSEGEKTSENAEVSSGGSCCRTGLLVFIVFLIALGAGIGAGFGIWGSDSCNDSGNSTTVSPDVSLTTGSATTGSGTTGTDGTIGPEVTSGAVGETTSAPSSDINLQVSKFGEIRGKINAKYSNVAEFFNIPFAQAPTGELRFKEPVPVTEWSNGTLDGTKYGKICMTKGNTNPETASEDCLHLNIWTPMETLSQGRFKRSTAVPVMVYIHGGAFFGGNNAKDAEEGAFLADEQKIVVVKINYRLGALGFWYLDEKETGQQYQGNWGMLDQRMALKWVFENVADFGGDPNAITISGCSAGGQSVWWHLQESGSWPYFQRAISHSSPGGIPYFTREEATQFSLGNARGMNCTTGLGPAEKVDLECLRSAPGAEVISAAWGENLILNRGPWLQSLLYQKITQMGEPYAPVIDAESTTDNHFDMIINGKIRPNTPIIYEYTTAEGEEFVLDVFGALTAKTDPNFYTEIGEQIVAPVDHAVDQAVAVPPAAFDSMLEIMFGTFGSTVPDNEVCDCTADLTPIFNCTADCETAGLQECDCLDTATRWLTTWSWTCNYRRSIQAVDDAFLANLYTVEVDLPAPQQKQVGDRYKTCYEKSCHCHGRYFMFGNYERDFADELDEDLRKAGQIIRDNYGSFIRDGTMSDFKSNAATGRRTFNYIDRGGRVAQEERFVDECDVFDSIDYYMQC